MHDYSRQLTIYEHRPSPLINPSEREWRRLEKYIGIVFPDDFKDFYCQVSAHFFEGELPSLYGTASDGIDWEELLTRERQAGLPHNLVPFCLVGNGDCHCFRFSTGSSQPKDIVYCYHDRTVDHVEVIAGSFSEWLDGYVVDEF